MNDWKILERKEIFMVGKIVKKRKCFWCDYKEDFECTWKSMYSPAHFKTLDEAKGFIRKITKTDVYHEV